MNRLFAKRRSDYYKKLGKYLPYIFNDHFVIIIFLLLGFLMIQYAKFVREVPEDWLAGKLILLLVSILSLFIGRLATFVERADKLFLLAKEEEVKVYLNHAVKNSLPLPLVVYFFVSLLSYPLASRLFSQPLLVILGQFFLLLFSKYLLLTFQKNSYSKNGLLDWDLLIKDEDKRQTNVLRLFSQFVDIPGIKVAAKPRKFFNPLYNLIKKNHKNTYSNLYARHFIRSGDYLGLYLRLGILAGLATYFIKNSLLSALLVLVFNFMIIFQLLPLKKAYDYQLLTKIYPIKEVDEINNLKSFIWILTLVLLVFEVILSLIFYQKKLDISIILLGTLSMLVFYMPRRINKRG